jgi:hypothetical protein
MQSKCYICHLLSKIGKTQQGLKLDTNDEHGICQFLRYLEESKRGFQVLSNL